MPKRFHDCGILHIWAFSESACLDLELSVSYSTTRDGYLVGWVRVGSFSAWVCLAASSVCLFSLWNWNVPKVEWAVQFSRNTCAGSAVGYTRWCSRVVLRFQVNVVRANCVARKHSSGVRGYKQNTVCTPWEALESTQAILHRSMDPTLSRALKETYPRRQSRLKHFLSHQCDSAIGQFFRQFREL